MPTTRQPAARSAVVAVANAAAIAIALGIALGIVTKAGLWLYERTLQLVWKWLPSALGVDATSLPVMVVILVIGGVLVGLGQRYLGYHPAPLETVVGRVRAGEGIDHRLIPRTVANTGSALAAGAPLGPESGLISVIGGVYFWAQERMATAAAAAHRLVTGADVESSPWRFAPTIIAGIVLIFTFHALPGGADPSGVPAYEASPDPVALALALIAGALGGLLGLGATRLERLVRDVRLFDRMPLVLGPLGGLAVAVLAAPSALVLFSGHQQMSMILDGTDDAELLYAGAAKLVAMIVVIAAGWKGGTIFPLMFAAGALAAAVAGALGLESVVLYAAAIGGAVAGALRSIALGVLISLLVVPLSLLLPILIGSAAGALVLRRATARA